MRTSVESGDASGVLLAALFAHEVHLPTVLSGCEVNVTQGTVICLLVRFRSYNNFFFQKMKQKILHTLVEKIHIFCKILT